MNQSFHSLLCGASVLALIAPALSAQNGQALKSNYQIVYGAKPVEAENFSALFSEGTTYGRIRSNTFYYDWEKESPTQNSHLISGLGGSLVYHSARFKGFDFGAGLYFGQAFFDGEEDPIGLLKPGKDLISRFDYSNTGNRSMGVLGQAYLHYSGIPGISMCIGRQLVETFYTKSNDTKMIPNTFDGIVADSKAIPDTSVRLAYLSAQKLRDHTQSHAVLMYGDANATGALKPQWSENDDSAMHKGLTYTRLKDAGIDTDAPLITGDLHNASLPGLKLDASFYYVPEMLGEIMAEANYKIALGSVTLTPGLRYIKQFDDGAGSVGGATYSGKLAGQSGHTGGYKAADSLDAQMVAARLVANYANYKLNLGYSNVLDESDLITPWRGFPTAGYTRSMARYNWMANTKSYRLEVMRNANAKGVYTDLFTQASVLFTDADETKGYYDEIYYYVGFVQNLPALPALQWRLRLGYNDSDKTNADNLDARFELNYLF